MKTRTPAVVLLVLLAVPAGGAELERFDYRETHMGVPMRLRLYASDEHAANMGARAAFDRISELEDVMSDYDGDSELMRLCRTSGPGRPVKVSDDLFRVLRAAAAISEQSAGAFDVTVGPVVKLWRRARKLRELPRADRLDRARALVDYRLVSLDETRQTVELGRDGMRLDLGGIAKGDAADQALRVLRSHGISRAMIDAGGDIVVGSPPPGQSGWRIGIAPLSAPDADPSRFLLLRDCSVATSGDAFQFVEIEGKRYSHIVDPHTGLGLTRRSSVTVIARDGMTADSLASAVSVLGPERGLALIERSCGAAGVVVTLEKGKPRALESRRLQNVIAPDGAPPR